MTRKVGLWFLSLLAVVDVSNGVVNEGSFSENFAFYSGMVRICRYQGMSRRMFWCCIPTRGMAGERGRVWRVVDNLGRSFKL